MQDLIDQTTSVPVVDPSQISQAFAQIQAVYGYYTVPPVLDVDHYVIDGEDRAVVIGARELDQNGINSSDQNWSNLHTVYTHGSGVIAAFGNQRPPDDSLESSSIEWAQGQDPDQDSLEQATGPFQQQIYFGQTGEGSPDYSIVGKAPGGPNVEVDMTPTGTPEPDDVRGRGRRRRRRVLPQADVRHQVRRPELPALLAGRARTARSSTTATRSSASRRSLRG